MLGIPYLADAVTAAVTARLRDESYRLYVTDRLYVISACLGVRPNKQYRDILYPRIEDTRPGKEIAMERLETFGVTVIQTEPG